MDFRPGLCCGELRFGLGVNDLASGGVDADWDFVEFTQLTPDTFAFVRRYHEQQEPASSGAEEFASEAPVGATLVEVHNR